MKVFEIFEADNPSFTQGRTTSGGVIVPDDFKPKITGAETVGETGNVKVTIEGPDGNVKTYEGSPKDILKDGIAENLPDAKKTKALSRWQKWKKAFRIWADKTKFFKFLTASGIISAAQIAILIKEYLENRAALKLIMESEFVDSAATRQIWVKSKGYLTVAFGTAFGVEVAGAVASAIAAGKVLRFARMARTGMLAFPGGGWIAAAITTLVLEGSIWALSWLINQHGPKYFAAWFLEEWSSGAGEIEIPPMSSSDAEEMSSQLARDREDSGTSVDDSSISRISSRIQGISAPETPSSSNNDSDTRSAVDRLRSLRNN